MSLVPFDSAITAVADLIGKFVPDKAQQEQAQAQFQLAMLTAQQQVDTAQSDTNKAEAANASIFVAGWRPFIGWVCGGALTYQYIVRPLSGAALAIAGHAPVDFPGLDDSLWQLMLGMLGLGGMRTYEKKVGVANNH